MIRRIIDKLGVCFSKLFAALAVLIPELGSVARFQFKRGQFLGLGSELQKGAKGAILEIFSFFLNKSDEKALKAISDLFCPE